MKKLFMSAERVSQRIRERGGKWKGKGGDVPDFHHTPGDPTRAVVVRTGAIKDLVRGLK